jgi:hypothetical protein
MAGRNQADAYRLAIGARGAAAEVLNVEAEAHDVSLSGFAVGRRNAAVCSGSKILQAADLIGIG